jgi:hypothetical protein
MDKHLFQQTNSRDGFFGWTLLMKSNAADIKQGVKIYKA